MISPRAKAKEASPVEKMEGGGKFGKGGKGKNSGEVCWTCGRPGHMARDCWRVRQVEAPATSPSTTLTMGATSGGGGESSTAAKNIRRVKLVQLVW